MSSRERTYTESTSLDAADISSDVLPVEDDCLSESNSGSNSSSLVGFSASARCWQDLFWLCVFTAHLVGVGFVLCILGLNRLRRPDRLNIDQYTIKIVENQQGLTENYWPLYGVAGGVGTILSLIWLYLLGSCANQLLKVVIHGLMTYLAVVSVLCLWAGHIFWGIAFAVGALLQFLYVVSVIDRFPFTMLVLQKAVNIISSAPEIVRAIYAFMPIMLLWMSLWTFGVAGVIASSIGDGGRWWLLVALSISLFWTSAVLCNIIHVTVSGMVSIILVHNNHGTSTMPQRPLVKALKHAVTSLGSICYGSLFTAAIRTLRWKIRGFRSKIGGNECLLCCIDFLFYIVEYLVRFFNKYAYVQMARHRKCFNSAAKDAWELLQSTGVEALVAYDCSGAVLFMGAVFSGLITGTCTGLWAWYRAKDRVIMVCFTAMLMGMSLVGMVLTLVEGAVTSIYICYAEDPLLIRRWDTEFFNEMSEMLHQRLQHRSAPASEAINRRLDFHAQEIDHV